MNSMRSVLAALALTALAMPALAQDRVTIYSAAPQDLLDKVIPAFEKSSKFKVEIVKGGSGDLVNRLKAEAPPPPPAAPPEDITLLREIRDALAKR